jgi:hypothetical protein
MISDNYDHHVVMHKLNHRQSKRTTPQIIHILNEIKENARLGYSFFHYKLSKKRILLIICYLFLIVEEITGISMKADLELEKYKSISCEHWPKWSDVRRNCNHPGCKQKSHYQCVACSKEQRKNVHYCMGKRDCFGGWRPIIMEIKYPITIRVKPQI